MKLSQIGELSLLEHIRRTFSRKAKDIIVGIGDDAAVINPSGKRILLTTDMMAEGVHFDLRFVTAYQLGFKLISVNVSDIYAMAGKPAYVLITIAVHHNTRTEFIHNFFQGVEAALKLYKIVLIGGDVSSAINDIALSATVIGYAENFIQRSGARTGDRLYVTGPLGDSACGLAILKQIGSTVPLQVTRLVSDLKPASGVVGCRKLRSQLSRWGLSWKMTQPLLRRHLMPEARMPKQWRRNATAMIDISDGLLIDLSRLCNESSVGARLYEEKIPISAEMKKAASCLGLSPLTLALSGGEDYELLFSAPPEKKVKALHIGDITESKRCIVDSAGKERPFSAEGYQHFANENNI
jgi:thiamine-monophosphate kinase